MPKYQTTWPRYQTTWPRVLFGIFAGAFTGASVLVAYVLFSNFQKAGFSQFDHIGFVTLVEMFRNLLAIWISAILLIGAVPWLILHRLNLRSWPVAVALGFSLPFAFAVAFLVFGIKLGGTSGASFYADDAARDITLDGWQKLRTALLFGAFGAVTALAVWRTAYRRTPDTGPILPNTE